LNMYIVPIIYRMLKNRKEVKQEVV
jgi:hypothetical protein